MRRALVLVAIGLAGCASTVPVKGLTSDDAIGLGNAYLDGRYEGAILAGVSAFEGNVTDVRLEWLADRRFTVQSDPVLLDGTSPSWFLTYLISEDARFQPATLVLQVTKHGIQEHQTRGKFLIGNSEPVRRNADDACFTGSSGSLQDLDILHGMADSIDVTAHLRDAVVGLGFMDRVQQATVSLVGAAGYGNTPEYWCYELYPYWRVWASDGDDGTVYGIYRLDGEPVHLLDWRTGAQVHVTELDQTFPDGPEVDRAWSHEVPFEVPEQQSSLWVVTRLTAGRGAEGMLREVVGPDGAVRAAYDGTSYAGFRATYPDPGTWLVRYHYTQTLPLSEHRLRIDVQTFGP